jgi:UDP-N-acetylmuramyl pentapeptide phosphotransferase/UDP-N-acetylglucosamine-1-phosphate transferase
MVRSRKTPLAGGLLLALSIIVGVVVGILHRQSSIGFLAGLGVGLVLLVLVWLIDRLR